MTLTARYADPSAQLAVTTDVIDLQLRHRSVRQFTADPVHDDQLAAIVSAAQSAATSSNLQAWSVVAVRDPARKARLAELANSQAFIDQAPVFLVWVADLGRARRLAERHARPLTGADYLESTILGFVDAALAAQNAVIAAESLGLGTVFVGAVRNHPIELAEVLDLPPHTIAAFGLAVGVPDPQEEADIKPRLPREAVLHHERYDATIADEHIRVYDERVTDYNRRFGLVGDWTARVLARLADRSALAGRHQLREHLSARGFPTR